MINQQLLQAMRRQSSTGISPYEPERGGIIPKSIKGLGETLTGLIAGKTGVGRESEKARQMNIESGDKLLKLFKTTKNKNRKKILFQEAMKAYQASGRQIEEIQKTLSKSDKQVAAEIMGTAGWLALGAAPAKAISNPLSRITWASLIGGGTGAKGALEREAGAGEIAKETVKGAAIGGAIAGAFELVGWGLRKLADFQAVKRARGTIFTRELQPKTKDLAKQIEMGWETTGRRIADATDDVGKPLYKGSYRKMQQQAQNQIEKQMGELRNVIRDYRNPKLSTGFNFKEKLVDKLEGSFGVLDDLQVKTVDKEIGRWASGTPDLLDILSAKQRLSKQIAPAYWIDPNAQRSFLGHLRYGLRDIMRESLEESIENQVGKNIVRELNQKVSLAMDVRLLSATQQAIRQKGALPFSTATRGMISSLLDRTIFNPFFTTRVAQGAKTMGQTITPIVSRGPQFIQGKEMIAYGTQRNIIINQLIQLLGQ